MLLNFSPGMCKTKSKENIKGKLYFLSSVIETFQILGPGEINNKYLFKDTILNLCIHIYNKNN